MGTVLLIDDVRAQLARQGTVEGTFTQKKFVKDMSTTLESSGEFRLDPTAGLDWKQKEPFVYDFRLTGQKIELVTPGSKPEVITKESQPLLFGFSQAFLGLFSGDLTELNKQFTVDASGDKASWKFKFIPREEMVKKAIRELRAMGGNSISSIYVEDARGNTMTMNFQLSKAKK